MRKLFIKHLFEDGFKKEIYKFTNIKRFSPINSFSNEIIEKVFEFAWGMSFGGQGHHRNYRSGGVTRRRKGQIFADTFQGKLAEFAIFDLLQNNDLPVNEPDLEMYEEGIWDSSDFKIKDRNVAVKSTKSFGNLLLLEANDWDNEGRYIPNIGQGNEIYHFFILVRLNPFATDLLRINRMLLSNNVDKVRLKNIILNNNYEYDIPGFITRKVLKELIHEKFFIPQGAYLSQRYEANKMDANNYYIQTGDMTEIDKLIHFLKNSR
jgi:hypothetical protein